MELHQGAENKAWTNRLTARPLLYTVVILVVMLSTFVVYLRSKGVFACPAAPYADGYYLAYCDAEAYADFEHGAYWFGLEPEAQRAAAEADVLFLGGSRLQVGFSTRALADWFAARGRTYHLLGFGYIENSNFAGPLLARLRPRARAYVINLDDYFVETVSPPAREILGGGDAGLGYEAKQRWQLAHRLICGGVPGLCSDRRSFFRDPKTGAWRLAGVHPQMSFVREEVPVDHVQVARGGPIAAAFIDGLGVDRRCIFLTYVWTYSNQLATAQALADELGFELVAPQLDGLQTFDTSHLTMASAERFASAVLQRIGPKLATCLDV